MPATLVEISNGESHELPKTALIGRSAESTVVLADPRTSRRHAMIRHHDDGYYFYDLGSFNGSYLNNIRVTTNRKLKNGDVLRIADEEFRFESSATMALDGDTALLSSTLPLIQKLPVIVLVSDIVGYTKLSEAMAPEELSQVIGRWYSDCDQILSSAGATIDKFLGDAVLAYWNPVTPENREAALSAAGALVDSCGRIEDENRELFDRIGLAFGSGIALHAGEVASGRMGQGEFTLVGDPVNLTFRLEELTRSLGVDVVVSDDFLNDWETGRDLCTEQGEHQVKGRVKPVEVFSVESFPGK